MQSIPYDATHYNTWRCTLTDDCINPGTFAQVKYNETYDTDCAVNAFTGKSEGGSAGCDHNAAAGFRYVDHRTEYPTPPSYSLRFCDRDMGAGAGKTVVDSNGHPLTGTGYCGTWTPDCGEFVSGPGTDAEHRHDTGTGHRACDTHVRDTAACPTWTAGHGHSSVSNPCPTPDPTCGEFASGTGTTEHRHASGSGRGWHAGCGTHDWDKTVCPTWTAGHGHSSVDNRAQPACVPTTPACVADAASPTVSHSHTIGGHTDCQTHVEPDRDCGVGWNPGHSHRIITEPCPPTPTCPDGQSWNTATNTCLKWCRSSSSWIAATATCPVPPPQPPTIQPCQGLTPHDVEGLVGTSGANPYSNPHLWRNFKSVWAPTVTAAKSTPDQWYEGLRRQLDYLPADADMPDTRRIVEVGIDGTNLLNYRNWRFYNRPSGYRSTLSGWHTSEYARVGRKTCGTIHAKANNNAAVTMNVTGATLACITYVGAERAVKIVEDDGLTAGPAACNHYRHGSNVRRVLIPDAGSDQATISAGRSYTVIVVMSSTTGFVSPPADTTGNCGDHYIGGRCYLLTDDERAFDTTTVSLLPEIGFGN